MVIAVCVWELCQPYVPVVTRAVAFLEPMHGFVHRYYVWQSNRTVHA